VSGFDGVLLQPYQVVLSGQSYRHKAKATSGNLVLSRGSIELTWMVTKTNKQKLFTHVLVGFALALVPDGDVEALLRQLRDGGHVDELGSILRNRLGRNLRVCQICDLVNMALRYFI
jgi:hypothetical protein